MAHGSARGDHAARSTSFTPVVAGALAAAGLALSSSACIPQLESLLAGELSAPDKASAAGRATPVVESITAQRAGPGEALRMFDLGPTTAGDEWTFAFAFDGNADERVVVALLDDRMRLVLRRNVRSGTPLRHVARRAASPLKLGVSGGASAVASFTLEARVTGGLDPAAPSPQRVWLDFRGHDGLRMQDKPALSFPAFDSALLGARYVGRTRDVKDAIVETLRAQYADFGVEFSTSDDGGPPPSPYSTLYFGGWHDALLGTADAIDRYNADPGDRALIYVESFARYEGMQLDPAQMGRMIGNTAAHELGHLLGLYHTAGADSTMDTLGSAWDYAGQRRLALFPLGPDVFPVGFDDAPLVLAETLGRAPLESESGKSAAARSFDADLHSPFRSPAGIEPSWDAALCDCRGIAERGD